MDFFFLISYFLNFGPCRKVSPKCFFLNDVLYTGAQKYFIQTKTVFSYFMIFLHRSRFSCPFWSLPKTLSALTFFRAVSLSFSLHVRHPMRIEKRGLHLSACHFHLVQFLFSAMPIIPSFLLSSSWLQMHLEWKLRVDKRERVRCVWGARGGGARGLWTVEFVSRCCWGGLKTCCNMVAGQTASGSQSGKPGKNKEDQLK